MNEYIEPYITSDAILEILDTIRPRLATHEIDTAVKAKGYSPNNIRAALFQLEKDGFIKVDGNLNDWYIRFGEGALFTKNGGYKTHFERLNEKEIEDTEMKKLTTEKTKVDLANAKRVYKTYFSTRAMAIIATIISAILLFLKLAEVFGWIGQSR